MRRPGQRICCATTTCRRGKRRRRARRTMNEARAADRFPLSRNSFMRSKTLLAIALTLSAIGSLAAATKRPNVLFILTDDQRSDALGLGGAEHLNTPNKDR